MRRPAILQSLKARFGPSRRLGIAIFVLLLGAWRIMEGESLLEQRHLVNFIYATLGLGYLYAIAPVPWQWTADGRRMAPFLRGLFQALVWNGALLFFGILLPVTFGNAAALLGQEEVAEFALRGHVTPFDFAWVIYTHSVWIACLVGWLIAREEAILLAAIEEEEIHRTLENTARQAQAQALQAQLDPHVLYNALSGISELIHEDTTKAEAAVVHLSGLYRKLTALGKQESVQLGEERQLLEDYLAVEQIRLGSRLQVYWEWLEALNDRRVPPLLVQPLVENAIKHGLSLEEEGGRLFISLAALEGDLLHIRVTNSGKPLDPEWREGTGLANLAARLALIGGGSSVGIRREGDLTVADLRVHSRRTP